MYVYIYIFIYTFSFWPQFYLFCNFCLFCGCVSLTRLTVSAGWRLLRFDKFMFWVKILSHIYPNFFICTVPFKFNLTSCIIFCMIILYRDLLYYIVFYILYYLYLGGFHDSDSLSLNSHPDMLFNFFFQCHLSNKHFSSFSTWKLIASSWCTYTSLIANYTSLHENLPDAYMGLHH